MLALAAIGIWHGVAPIGGRSACLKFVPAFPTGEHLCVSIASRVMYGSMPCLPELGSSWHLSSLLPCREKGHVDRPRSVRIRSHVRDVTPSVYKYRKTATWTQVLGSERTSILWFVWHIRLDIVPRLDTNEALTVCNGLCIGITQILTMSLCFNLPHVVYLMSRGIYLL